jgi:hypothetical protein
MDKVMIAANVMVPRPGAMMLPKMPEKPQGIRAYHGSPHDFDRFDLSKIGTGQGAGASGRGINLAAHEALDTKYRDLLSEPKGSEAAIFEARAARSEAGGDIAAAEKLLQARLGGNSEFAKEAIGYLNREPGHMYEVNVNASPSQLLDLDAPLYKQSPLVQDALRSLGVWREPPRYTVSESKSGGKFTVKNVYGDPVGTFKDQGRAQAKADERTDAFNKGAGSNAYTRLGGNTIYNHLDDGAASNRLQKHGVVGTRADAGLPNERYVIFNPDIADILRKYGIGGVMAGGAAAAAIPWDRPAE